MWLIVREEIKAQPHIRAFTDYLAGYIRQTLSGSTFATAPPAPGSGSSLSGESL